MMNVVSIPIADAAPRHSPPITHRRWGHAMASLVLAWAIAACASTASPPAATPTLPDTESTIAPVTTTAPSTPRVLLVGDSTLLAIETYGRTDSLRGFGGQLDAASCRTLGVESCGPHPRPANTVDVITESSGPWDIVVVMAGYDEWWTTFPASVNAVATAARAHGADHLLVLNYREGVGYVAPDGRSASEAFERNNDTLAELEASGEIPELVVADWAGYTATDDRAQRWLTDDGIHLTPDGATALGGYISAWVAHLSERPCPDSVVTTTPCANPDR